MVLLSPWEVIYLPVVIATALIKFSLGYVAILLNRWFAIDLTSSTSVKGMRCSLDGLFKVSSTQGVLTIDNLQFFSEMIVDFYLRNHGKENQGEDGRKYLEKPIVKSFHLDKSAINHLADVNFFVEIEYDLDHPWIKQLNARNDLPQSVFVKTLPRRLLGKLGQVFLAVHEGEAINFSQFFSTQEWFPSQVMPSIIYANYNYYTSDYLIITEDLRGRYQFRGYSPNSITKEEKFKLVETIAKVHASGMSYLRSFPESERKIKIDQLDSQSPSFCKKNRTITDFILLLVNRYSASKMADYDIHPEIIDMAKQYFQSSNVVAKVKLCEGAEEMLSFVHRDLHFNNIGIGHEIIDGVDTVSVKLVDWQCCGVGNPLFDLFYLICFTSSLETVEAVEKEYLENYYQCICKELEQRGLSKPKQLQSYENYLEFYQDAMFPYLTWCIAIQLLATQAKGSKNIEVYNSGKNFLQSGAHLLMKYGNPKKRINKILNH